MAFEVKVYKPNKDGKLAYTHTLSPHDVSGIHWDKFNVDNKYALPRSSIPVYHRIGKDLQECVGPNCKEEVADPRSITCSRVCQLQRARLKRKESKQRSRARGNK
tara:strand:+ start:713 stop:1027 length:315 start_codon:yes stop_codon:yes gene_type:complete